MQKAFDIICKNLNIKQPPPPQNKRIYKLLFK